jgi:hypothetical protein
MRQKLLSLLSCFVLCLCAPAICAAQAPPSGNNIRLICKYSHTIDAQGKQGPTSGESLFTVVPLRDGRVTVQKQGLGAQFSGTMTEVEISADVSYEITNTMYAQSLNINRFTGELQITFGEQGKAGLVHFGSCRQTTKPLF